MNATEAAARRVKMGSALTACRLAYTAAKSGLGQVLPSSAAEGDSAELTLDQKMQIADADWRPHS